MERHSNEDSDIFGPWRGFDAILLILLWTQPASVAQGGNGVVTPGCPACRKRLFTMANFMDHLADDVLPRLIESLSAENSKASNQV